MTEPRPVTHLEAIRQAKRAIESEDIYTPKPPPPADRAWVRRLTNECRRQLGHPCKPSLDGDDTA